MCFVIIIIPKKERNRSLTKFVQRAVFLYVDPCSEIMPLAWRVGKINFPDLCRENMLQRGILGVQEAGKEESYCLMKQKKNNAF